MIRNVIAPKFSQTDIMCFEKFQQSGLDCQILELFFLLNQIPKLQNQQLINDAMLQYCSHNANSLNREPSITFNDYCSIFNLRSGSLELHIPQTNAGQLVPIVMFFLTLYPM